MMNKEAAMKKIVFAIAALAAGFGLGSCSVEPMFPVDENEGVTVLSAVFEGEDAETRTVRMSDGAVRWIPGDQISVFTAAGSNGGACFTSTNSSNVVRADFAGTIAAPGSGKSYYALYPYASSVSFDGSAFQVTLPNEQEAVADTFADDLFISIGRTTTQSMTFYHLTAGVKFTVTEPGIQAAVLVGLGNEYIAGEVKAALGSDNKTPYVQEVIAGNRTITLTAPSGQTLEPGKAYHIVTLPVTFENGFSLLLQKTDGSVAVKTVTKRVEIQRAHFGVLNEADKGLTWEKDYFEMSPYSFDLTSRAQEFKLFVRSSAEPHIDLFDDWVSLVKVEGDYRAGAYYVFRAERNRSEEARTSYISVCTDTNCYMATVSQEGSVEGDWMNADFVHHSFGMRFTATWCQWCPKMNEAFKSVREQMGDKFEYACYYATSGNYGFSGTETMMNQYKASGYPTGILDGRLDIPNYTDPTYTAQAFLDGIKETEANYPTVTALELQSSLSGNKASVSVNVYLKANDSYKLTVLLVENNIVGDQKDGNVYISDFVHNKVTRIALTSVLGDAFQGEEGMEKSFSFSCDIPDDYVKENLEVVAYVQRPFGAQPVISSDNYGGYYVDNARAAALGAIADLELE